jgi:hypothetical protein
MPVPISPKEYDKLDCGPGKTVNVPQYYFDTDGNLQLLTFLRFAHNLFALEYHGVRYGYEGKMLGLRVSSAYYVTWIDQDGSGRFTLLVLGSHADEIPDWAKRRAAKRCGEARIGRPKHTSGAKAPIQDRALTAGLKSRPCKAFVSPQPVKSCP